MQRPFFLAVLAERHNAVKLLVVLTANLAAELIHLILKVNIFRLTACGSSNENKTAEQMGSSWLTLWKGCDSQNKNIKTTIFAAREQLKGNTE